MDASKVTLIAENICVKSSGLRVIPVENVAITVVRFVRIFAEHCNKCSDTESPGADTLFHKVKFGSLKAFHICFEMGTSKGMSALQVGRRYGIRPDTARVFMHKVTESMKSSGNYPLDGEVHVDEFVVGGKKLKRPDRSEVTNPSVDFRYFSW